MDNRFSIARVSGTTIAQAIIPRRAFGRAGVKRIHVTSDKAASVLKWRRGTTSHVVSAAAASGDSVLNVDTTSGATAGDLICIEPKDGTAPFLKTVAGGGVAATTFTITGTLGAAVPAGSLVSVIKDHSQFPVGATSVQKDSPADADLAISSKELPLVAELDGTSACSINELVGEWR